MRPLLFYTVLFLSIFSNTYVYSLSDVIEQKYFDFDPQSNLLQDGKITNVKFRYNIPDLEMSTQKRLRVRPYLSSGAVEIFNEESKRFVNLADLNSDLPYLRGKMKLKFTGVQGGESPVLLKFVITDVFTGKNYDTPDKKMWGTAYYRKYTQLLNENILKAGSNRDVATEVKDGVISKDSNKDPVKVYLWYLSPAFFLYGLLKSSNGYG